MVSRIDTQQTLNSDLFVILSIYVFWFSVFFCGGLLVVHLDKTMVQVESETLRHERKMYIKETLQVRVSRSTGIHVKSCIVCLMVLSILFFFFLIPLENCPKQQATEIFQRDYYQRDCAGRSSNNK